MAQDIERRLAAVLAADVAGFSRLTDQDEVGTMHLLTAQRAILDAAIARHKGRIANTAGDSVLAEFPSAVNAVRCAIEAQQMLRDAAEGADEDRRVLFRIGIHVGDVMVRGGDLLGSGVNVAARLEGLAPTGGVVISAAAHEQVKKILPFAYMDLGPQSVKNIEEPVRAFAIGTAQAAAVKTKQTLAEAGNLSLPDRPSIAVLPFQNMSGDPEQEYFADGVVEDIITALSRFKSLFVIARNSSFTYKGKAVDIKQVGRELGVRYVLEGSVRKGGGRVRITGQLIDAATGAHLWANKFDGSLADVFDLQDEVTRQVVSAIAPALEVAEIERANRKPTELLQSYDLFLKGMALYYARRTITMLEEARATFVRAAELDGNYAAAHAMVGVCDMNWQASGGTRLPASRLEDALRFAERARTLDEDDAFVQARAGHVLVYLGQKYDLGLSLVDRAVNLNANLAPAWYARGSVQLMCDRAAEALRSFEQMMRLSPRDPLLIVAWFMTGWAHFVARDYEAGLVAADKAVQRQPEAHSLAAFAANAIGAGKIPEARLAAQQLLQFQPDFRASHSHYLFPTRSLDVRNSIQAALRDAGIPD